MSFGDAITPFDRMLESFGYFARLATTHTQDFKPMSVGVNQSKPNKAVIKLLQSELSSALTLRDCGNAGGSPVLTHCMAICGREINLTSGLDMTFVHGTTEGAYLTMQLWAAQEHFVTGDRCLTFGHIFLHTIDEPLNMECASAKLQVSLQDLIA